METSLFNLTPEQKSLLQSLSQETGKSISALIAEALEGLQEHVCPGPVSGKTDDSKERETAVQPPKAPKPIWEQFVDAFKDVPEEELDRLPIDAAAQHDHYIYGTPKRPT
jgi:hypothetical protein